MSSSIVASCTCMRIPIWGLNDSRHCIGEIVTTCRSCMNIIGGKRVLDQDYITSGLCHDPLN